IGDTAFNLDGLTATETAGIHTSLPDVRHQQLLMAERLKAGDAIFPAHDWTAPARLKALSGRQAMR
ncbi:MAG: hypothetical protein AAFS10_16650, partial [Myxococcota bacterium]